MIIPRVLYTKGEAAEALAISVRKLSGLVASGRLVPTRIDGAVRFRLSELEAFAERETRSNVYPMPGRPERRRRAA